ncbi:hypothetical protein AMTRI_Chr07g27230 [Amborella trichopoda]
MVERFGGLTTSHITVPSPIWSGGSSSCGGSKCQNPHCSLFYQRSYGGSKHGNPPWSLFSSGTRAVWPFEDEIIENVPIEVSSSKGNKLLFGTLVSPLRKWNLASSVSVPSLSGRILPSPLMNQSMLMLGGMLQNLISNAFGLQE